MDDFTTPLYENLHSPVEITRDKIIQTQFEKFNFYVNSYKRKHAAITNTGCTIEIKYLDATHRPVIDGGGLEGEYILEKIHFHWPAEHIINGYRYPLEGHFIYCSNEFSDFPTALKHPNGVAVFGVFYEVTPWDNPFFKFTTEIAEIAQKPKEPYFLEHPIAVRDFLPLQTNQFFRYHGSINKWEESVIWTLFSTPLYISKLQRDYFPQILDENGQQVKYNCRPLKELHDRRVLYAI